MIALMRTLLIVYALSLLNGVSARADEAQEALVTEGEKAYDDGDYKRAKSILLPLADAGNPKAMNMVGLLYIDGRAFPQNPTAKCDWYERAAQLEYPGGQYNLSVCYALGIGRPKDAKIARQWTERAANNGSPNAQIRMAGYFIENDRAQYLYWMRKAADQGNALGRLAMWREDPKSIDPPLTFREVTCIVVMITLLDKHTGYCD